MPDAIRWDAELIHRYDRIGPRYMSYPTVARFSEKIGSFDLLHALRDSRQAGNPLSLYIHLPFCASVCHYCSCDKVITQDRLRIGTYLDQLEKEIELIACHLGPEQHVEQLYVGGGTPTLFKHDELRRLMGMLRRHFHLSDDNSSDYGIEIDPRETKWSTMGLLRELGFNRISIGVQDLDPQVLQAVNRQQTFAQTQAIVEAARTLQFRSINIDLIYGLPQQTTNGFEQTLESIVSLQPDRIRLFGYIHQPEQFAPQRRIDPSELPGVAARLSMLQRSIEQLADAGYRHIGLEHFALPDDELAMAQEDGTLQRDFQGYTTHGHCDLIGLGVAAISQIGNLYCQNSVDLDEYEYSLRHEQLPTRRGLSCSRDDHIRRAIIQQLLCTFELRFAMIEQTFGIDFRAYFSDAWPMLEQMARDRLLLLDDKHLRVTPFGRLLIRAVCRQFDRYFQEQADQLFSEAI